MTSIGQQQGLDSTLAEKFECCFRLRMLRLCVVLIALFAIGETTFTPNFRNFLKLTFGAEAEKNLSRVDVGVDGSFGGGNHKALLRTK